MHFAIPLILFGFTLNGCSNSQFGGAGSSAVGGNKKPTSSEPKKDDGQGLGGPSEDDETDPAEDPVMVSGAYLTCVQDDALPSDEANVTAGCVAKVDATTKMSLTALDEKSWSILDLFNRVESAKFTEMPENSPYHVTVSVPRQGLALLTVRLGMKKKDQTAELFAKIEGHGDSGGAISVKPGISAPQPIVKDFGKTQDYQLGDDSYKNQGRDCSQQLQNIALSGASLTFTLVVKTDAKVAITMGHMCGINRSLNYVQVNDGSPNHLFNGVIPTNSKDFAIPALDLKAGTYTLNIVSPKWGPGTNNPNDRDDFVIGDFRFVTDGLVEVQDPVANQFVEP